MTKTDIEEMMHLAVEFRQVLDRDIPKVPTLVGKTVALLFYEASTRTRLSFERAAKALSADTLTFTPGGSSVAKGESLKDTALTLKAMGPDLMVVRHGATGAPWRVADWTGLPVVNAGDGAHQHPTQALLDAFTLHDHVGDLAGLRTAIIGDIRHSRVARSTTQALLTLGAEVTLVAPTTLLPVDLSDWGVKTADGIDEILNDVDLLYLLRIQQERGGGAVFPSIAEYVGRFGLTRERAERLADGAHVMHPGPMNRGVEIDPDVADGPRSLVTDQVTNGIAIRMAVLYSLLEGRSS
ncbi:MAG: aspartate carbamoyltransferase catalytic subunit [Acidimicrobiia bacterium]|nr:aspartate carbamoyltransferase catalytic subunit [Acidimicrobiia bacterium]